MRSLQTHMNKTLLPIITLALLFVAMPGSVRAEGELAWQYDAIPTSYQYSDVAVTADGVFAPSWVSWGQIAVEKRATDNSGGWKNSFAVPTGSWANGTPHIAADATGVYVAAATAITINLRNGTLAIAKLSPVSGAIIQIRNSNAPGYVNVTNVEVDSTGVYVAGGSSADRGFGGTSWRLEKWKKDLSDGTPIWGYSSAQSGGNAGDYWGPGAVAMNASSIYLGGSRLNPGPGTIGIRIDKVDKSTGGADWVRLEPYGSGAIGVMALDGSNLYTVSSSAYWGGFSMVYASRLEKRPLMNGPALWAIDTADKTIALAVDGTSGLYRGYVASGDASHRMMLDKRSLLDGQQIGTTTIASGVLTSMRAIAGFFGGYLTNNLSVDASGLYIAGRDESGFTWGSLNSARIEKYNHFGSVPGSCGPADGIPTATAPTPTPATPPNNLCTSGSTPTVTDAGASFTWTCDGPDGLPVTPDDAACSAPKIATLSLCTTGGIPIASTPGPHSRSLVAGTSEILNAYYDTTPNICGDTSPVTNASWSDDPLSTVVSIAGATASPQTVTAGASGTERVTISRGAETILLDYTVSVPCNPTTTCGEQSRDYCQGQPFTIPDNGCGSPLNCTGTRFCDFNWKEVAPGN